MASEPPSSMASSPSSPQHSRSSSGNSIATNSDLSPYHLILDHLLSYPGSYEIPLRTMFTLNSVPRAQPLPRQLLANAVNGSAGGAPSNQVAPEDQQPPAQLTASLLAQISQLPSQTSSLPPSFINAFVRRCFPKVLEDVEFSQALTSLDYLKDLEMRRRRELIAALSRLGIQRNSLGTPQDDFSTKYPRVAEWVQQTEERERKIEALYSQLFVAVRRWLLINEMCLEPFSKQNCLALLNTLYPPLVNKAPTSKLTPLVLQSQRDGFFRYIQAVEKAGPEVLNNLVLQGRRPGEKDGWSAAAETIDAFLILACSSIDEFCAISAEQFIQMPTDQITRKGRKVDSGVSFGSEKKSSSRPSTGEETAEDRPRTLESSGTHSNVKPAMPSPSFSRTTSKGSALDKIVRELRRLGRRNKLEVEEIIDTSNASDKSLSRSATPSSSSTASSAFPSFSSTRSRSKGLRRMKSMGALGEIRNANASAISVIAESRNAGGTPPVFDQYEMQRQRMLYEARMTREGPKK